jgi:hypothetical protein
MLGSLLIESKIEGHETTVDGLPLLDSKRAEELHRQFGEFMERQKSGKKLDSSVEKMLNIIESESGKKMLEQNVLESLPKYFKNPEPTPMMGHDWVPEGHMPDIHSPFIQPTHISVIPDCKDYVVNGKVTPKGQALSRNYDSYQKLRSRSMNAMERALFERYRAQDELRKEFAKTCGDNGMIPNASYTVAYDSSCGSHACTAYKPFLIVCPGLLIGAGNRFEDIQRRLMFVIGHELGHSHTQKTADPRLNHLKSCMSRYVTDMSKAENFLTQFGEIAADEWAGNTLSEVFPALKTEDTLKALVNQVNGQTTTQLLDRLNYVRESAQIFCVGSPESASHPADSFRIKHSFLENTALRKALGCRETPQSKEAACELTSDAESAR